MKRNRKSKPQCNAERLIHIQERVNNNNIKRVNNLIIIITIQNSKHRRKIRVTKEFKFQELYTLITAKKPFLFFL